MSPLSLRKAALENRIRKLQRQLEELEAEPEPSFLQPIEDTSETYLVRTKEERRRRLEAELERCRIRLAELEKQMKKPAEGER